MNSILAENRSGYRVVGRVFVPISDKVELETISQATLQGDRFEGARAHILAGLAAFAQKPIGDYRNCIREAISAVESAAKVVCGNNRSDLASAIKIIGNSHHMHPAFKDAISKLYAWTSDEKGIRHALLEEDAAVDEADAHFMLVACAGFVNFLVAKYGKLQVG